MLDQMVEAAIAETETSDPETFAQLVRDNQAMVFSMALSSLRDRALAEEVAQDVFLELYRQTAPFQSPSHVRNWLRKVAANRCIDQSRRRKYRPQLGLDDVREPAAPEPESDPMLGARLRRLVGGLPEKARLVMVLRYQEDLDPAEIAETLDMPVGTVKSHLRRSLDLLRRKMAGAGGGIAI